jgi:hypothetical protein
VPTPTVEALVGASMGAVSGTNLNALASNALVLAAAISNVQGDSAGGGYDRARLKLHLDSMTVAAGGIVDGWFLTAADGSVYEQGGTSVVPLRPPDFAFYPVAQTAAVDLEIQVRVPICGTIKTLLRNNGLGAAMPSNNNGYLHWYPRTDQIPSV